MIGSAPAPAAAAWQASLLVRGGKDGLETTRVASRMSGDAVVAFGSVNALPGGKQHGVPWLFGARERSLENGKYLVATLVLSVELKDGPLCAAGVRRDCVPMGQTVQVFLHQTPVSFPASRLRYAHGKTTPWDRSGAGAQVSIVPELLRAGLQHGDEIVHQVALYVENTDLAGPKTVPIHYSIETGQVAR